MHVPRIARFRTVADLRAHCAALGAPIPFDDEPLSAAAGSPLAAPIRIGDRTVGNRWCIHPMEGWDATADGRPTDILLRRWRNFGTSGAKFIWGGEAVAVVAEGRANPNQLCAPACGREGFSALLEAARVAHREAHGTTEDFLVALQLTHSGRFSKPTAAGFRPRIAYHHPVLDGKHKVDPHDAAAVGFDMVDVKACHGYLLHEFLSARRRPGKYGGDFDGRTHLLRTIIGRIRSELPGLPVCVRLSLFDVVPWHKVGDHGEPFPFAGSLPYDCGFGVDTSDPTRMDLAEPIRLLEILRDEGVATVNLSAGSPYTVPHIQRPAADSRRRIRWWACGGRSRPRGGRRPPCPTSSWWVPATRTCRTTSSTPPRPPCGRGSSTSWGWGGWCSRIPSCRPIPWRVGRWSAVGSAARSATAPRRPAMACGAAAIRSTTLTSGSSPRRRG
ncbi:MAG: hypothetical protein ACKONH_06340 [Planctomycetia bacterium]